jgi:predicted nucleotidyltransferase component of viral defense system
MIPRRNLSLLSNRLAQGGGRRLPEAVLERDYCIAWFLVGLATSPLRDRLAFKGGTALKRCYFGEYRFSEDLDFTLLQPVSLPELLAELGPLYQAVRQHSGILFRFLREDRQPHANTHTFYLSYEGPLPGGDKEIKVDITIHERLVAPPLLRPLLRAYAEHTDLPEDARILVYPLSEIATEKLVALTDPARSEPRDLYDLWFLLEGGHVAAGDLQDGFLKKLAFKGLEGATPGEALTKKGPRLKRDWERRLASQMVALPSFDGVLRALRRHLRQAGLLGSGAGRRG